MASFWHFFDFSMVPAAADGRRSPLLTTIYISTIAIYGIAIIIHASFVLSNAPGSIAEKLALTLPADASSLVSTILREAAMALACVALPAYMCAHLTHGSWQAGGEGASLVSAVQKESYHGAGTKLPERIWMQQHPEHALIPCRYIGNLCDLCGAKGTDFRCSAGCDYDACLDCCEEAIGSSREASTAEEVSVDQAPEEVFIEASQRGRGAVSESSEVVEQTAAERWLLAGASINANVGPISSVTVEDIPAGDAAAGCGASAPHAPAQGLRQRHMPPWPQNQIAEHNTRSGDGLWRHQGQDPSPHASGHESDAQHPRQWQSGSQFLLAGQGRYESGFGNPPPQTYSF